ncbi:alpha/beta hydrolase [Geotalea sp. SG265]|uniref:alpha/beta fold hydrolase n=1 Tax=Geotalea sp. SG265 TaxID=2922867 RepID=UPI001FAFB24B|nr:alpha/beta hydrolase [Geotalea sp. SG265]
MRFQRQGLSLSYEDAGAGLPMILIHGFPLNRQMWAPQVKAVTAAGFRLVTPDLRGFGESDVGTGLCTMDTYADDVIALMDHLALEKAVVGGMSMGGYVLLDLLARYPQRIAAPCFIVTRSGADDDAGKAKRTAMADDAKKFGARIVADIFAKLLFAEETVTQKPELVAQVAAWMRDANPAGMACGLLAMRDRPDHTPLLTTIAQPALVIGAAEDRAMAREYFHILAAGLSHAGSCMIAGAGHMVNMEKAEEFNACLLRFLQGLKSQNS